MNRLLLKPHHLIKLKNHFSLQLKETGEEVCVESSLFHFYEELQKGQSLREIFMSLRKRNLLLSVKDVALFVRSLQEKNFFVDSTGGKSLFLIRPLRMGLSEGPWIAGLLESLVLLISIVGIFLFFNSPRTFDFFTEAMSVNAALAAVSWVFIYVLFRAFLISFFVRWHCGFYPPIMLGFSQQLFGFFVPVASLNSLTRFHQAFVWLAMSLSPLAVSSVAFVFLGSALAIPIMWLGILFTLKNLNPMKDSDISKFLRAIIGVSDWEHLLPYLKTKSLTAVVQQKVKSVKESRLVAFSSLAVLWIVIFCSLGLDIFLTNYPRWIAGFQGESTVKVAALISLGVFVFMTGEALLSLYKIIVGNVAAFFSKLANNRAGAGNVASWDQNELKIKMMTSPVFEDLSPEQWKTLFLGGQVRSFKEGSVIIKQGEVGHQMYFLLKGSCRVTKSLDSGLEMKLADVAVGSVFGEVALLEQVTRSASVTAVEDCVVYIIERETFSKVWTNTLDLGQGIKKRIFLSRALSASALLKDVPAEVSDIFLKKGAVQVFSSGNQIIREGDFSTDFYIILQGQVSVEKGGKSVAELSSGQFFGEIAILENLPRMATVAAVEETTVLKLQVEDFWDVISQNLQLALNIEVTALQSKNLI